MLRRSVVSVQCADQTCLCLVYIPYTHRNSAIAVRHTSPNNVNDERQQIETFIVNRIISTNTCTHLCTKQLVHLHFTVSVPRCSISDAEFDAFVDYQQDHLHHRPTLFHNKFNRSRLWLPFMFICRKIFRKKKNSVNFNLRRTMKAVASPRYHQITRMQTQFRTIETGGHR